MPQTTLIVRIFLYLREKPFLPRLYSFVTFLSGAKKLTSTCHSLKILKDAWGHCGNFINGAKEK